MDSQKKPSGHFPGINPTGIRLMLLPALLADLLLFLFLVTGCEDVPVRVLGPEFRGSQGVFIVNEGNFMYGNASLSFYDGQHRKVYNNIFFIANEIPLGDVAQSMAIYDGTAYLVVNNSARILCIDPSDGTLAGKITGFDSPRHILFLNNEKAYVSDLYARRIHVINPWKYAITGEIGTDNHSGQFNQHSVEKMVLIGDRVFAACWSYDNAILVIDPVHDRILDSVMITKQPNSMVTDRHGRLWILSDGGYEGSPYGMETPALSCIDPDNLLILKKMIFPSRDMSPIELSINGSGDTLYYLNTDVYRMPVDEDQLPREALIRARGRLFYSLGIDPVTSEIYLGDAIDYQQAGTVYRYRSDVPVDSFRVGVIPGAFCFMSSK